jgi:hypothetical protein
MDSILKAFSIGFLLRSVFSGIFFVISYSVACHDPPNFEMIEGKSIFFVALLVALFASVTAYGIHRSLIYPWIEWFFNSESVKALRQRIPLISTSTIRTLLWRWNQNAQGAKFDCKQINEHFDTWADFIHLQYASTLCIGLGALVGVIIVPGKHPPSYPLIVLAVFLFLAAFVSNWRSHSVLDYVRELADRE